MKRKLNSNSGVTLISLSLTIAIMLVLAITISININTYMEKKERANLETDILKLQEEIANYYNKNNSLPIMNEYTNTVLLKKNINDNEKYYVIDLSKLTNLNLNYGADYNKIENKQEIIDNLFDIYIINEQSHTIYYPKGVQYKGKFYYTIEDESNTEIGDIQLTEIEIIGQSSGEVNEEIQLNIKPKFVENLEVNWSSSDTSIAEIDENGKVILKAAGTVKITAVLKENEAISKDYQIECYSKIVAGEGGYEGGTYNDPYIPKGFKHIGTEEWNQGYTIIGETSSKGNEFVWVPCIITEKQIKEAQTNEDIVQLFQKKLDYPKYTGLEVTGDEAEAEYIKTSVGNYGGFYIAKYEAGIPGKKASVTTNHNTSTKGDILPLSQPNVGVWNWISRTDAITVSKAMIDYDETGVHSTLISGAAWDTTLQWITNTEDKYYAVNSTDKGNYSGKIAVTSSNLNTSYSKNNIYDMAGNVYEYTTENCTWNGAIGCVNRGRMLRQ